MIKYKIENYELLKEEYKFQEAKVAENEVLYLPMPNKSIVLYVVLKEGLLRFERNLIGPKAYVDFDQLEKTKYQAMEDFTKARRIVDELVLFKIVSKLEGEKDE